MAYEPKTWKCGDVVTAEALNHLERGVADAGGGSAMIVRMNTEGVADKTWQEVYDALANGTSVYTLSLIADTETGMEGVTHALILMAMGGNGNYGASIMAISRDGSSVQTGFLIADSADGYLRATTGGGQ